MIGAFQRMNSLQPAEFGHELRPGRQEQVKGVAEDHLVAELDDVAGLERLDRTARRQRHERRRADVAVGEMQHPAPGAGVRAAGDDLKHGRDPSGAQMLGSGPMPLRALTALGQRSWPAVPRCSGCGSGAGTHTAATTPPARALHVRARRADHTAGTGRRPGGVRQACAACHSVSGHNSPRQQGGDLLHFHSTRAQLVQLTREMPILHHRLSDSEVAAVVSYLRT